MAIVRRAAAPARIGFKTFERADALLVDKSLRRNLSQVEFRRMVQHHFASVLAEDDLQGQSDLRQFTSEERETLLDRFGLEARSEHDVAIGEVLGGRGGCSGGE